jgi:hypothetical protein
MSRCRPGWLAWHTHRARQGPRRDWPGWRAALREFSYGMSGYEIARHAMEERAARETVFLAVTLGDMVGLPVMPPYYALRLLPYAVTDLAAWKRRALRERMLTDHHDFDLHGV